MSVRGDIGRLAQWTDRTQPMICSSCHGQAGADHRFCPMCGAPLRAATREARKSVAILFMDLVGSTTLAEWLDPEPLRQIMDRYFTAVSTCIADHGGAVEKYIGDAVMAVFGAAVSHEDDALRAVRAAAAALAQVSQLSAGLSATHKVSLEVRCGICSGEVMAITTPDGNFRVIGDPVNTAARLQTAAGHGEILVDAVSASMIRAYVGLEPVPPLMLKGKAQPVPAWRVTDPQLPADGASAPRAAPLIGRDDELDELRQAFRRVTRRQQLRLVTVLGAPGIGKSRLVRDFVAEAAAADMPVLTGKCSAYGRGITYKPLTEMLGSYPGGWPELAARLESADDSARRAVQCLSSIMTDAADGPDVAVGVEEISWAVRYLLTVLGKTRPVVMIWEDLHWAEATLLDLIDDVVSWLSDVPVLLLCVARNELLETRPTWGGGKSCAMALELPPLTPAQCAELVTELATVSEVFAHEQDALCERVALQCEGNPLFAELMLDVFAETAPGARLPPTIQALLTARLDQLPQDERQLLEIAATIGREFRWDVLRAMVGADDMSDNAASDLITQLVRRRVIQRTGADGFRFGQALLRDTAYALSPKARREHWHLFLADWYDRAQDADGPGTTPAAGPGAGPSAGPGASHGSGQDGRLTLAYHIEAASLLRRELRPGDASLPDLAARAAQILIAEGTTALHRKDLPGAAALLERGRSLLPADDPQQTPLALYICDSWLGLSDADRALAALAAGEESLRADPRHRAVCEVQRCIVSLLNGLMPPDAVAADAEQIAAVLPQGPDNDLAWCRLFQLQAYLHFAAERPAKAEAQMRQALHRARSMQDSYEEDRIQCAICEMAQWTPTPAAVGLALCAKLISQFATNRALLVPILLTRARLSAIADDLDDARAALDTARTYTSDLHLDLSDAAIMAVHGLVTSLADEHDLAEASYRRSQALLLEMGRTENARTFEALAARELFEQDRIDQASAALDRLTNESADLDLRTQIIVQSLAARIASARGQHEQALELAAQTVQLSESADDLCLQGDAHLDRAIILQHAGRAEQSDAQAAMALDRYHAKGATLLAARVDRRLARA
jgi:class 3 adenylate cyclase/tetratricopeptide (TPR) repeat protein